MPGVNLAFLRFQRLPQAAVDELRGILETYAVLKGLRQLPDSLNQVVGQIQSMLDQSPQLLWWSDLEVAELCVVAALPDEEVRAHLMGWRRRLHQVIGDAKYAEYLASAPDAVNEQDVAKLRADLGECIRAVYYFYSAYGVAAVSRTHVTQRLMKSAGLILVIEAAILALIWRFAGSLDWTPVLSVAIAASAAAVVGSVISVQRRLQDPTVDVDPFYRYIQTDADWFGIAVVSPLFAAIFGALLYSLIVSSLIGTSMVSLNNAVTGLGAALPKEPKDYAALLVLAFISGFAEQFIPDALTRIASRALTGAPSGGPQQPAGTQQPGGPQPPPVPQPPSVPQPPPMPEPPPAP
jgi:hypothetical protein